MPIDYSKYPENWKSEIRPRILERAKNCCENCGLENGSTAIRFKDVFGKIYWINGFSKVPPNMVFNYVKVVLTIAHLDHDETNKNVSDDRLKAMCQLCHLRYDAKEKAKRKILKNKIL